MSEIPGKSGRNYLYDKVFHAYKIECRLRGIPQFGAESAKSHGLDKINDHDNSGMFSLFSFLRAIIKQYCLSAAANHEDVRDRSWPVCSPSLPAIRGGRREALGTGCGNAVSPL